MTNILFLNKNKILIILVSFSVINFLRLCVVGWKEALAVLLLKLWLVRGIYNFIHGKAFRIAPGEIASDAEPWVRVSVATFAFSFYLIIFFVY